MTPFRRETRIPSNQPVRFYKIVALSFLVITIVLLGMIVFMSSKRATVIITTKENPVDITFTVGVADKSGPQVVSGAIVSTTVSVSETFSPTGTQQEPGTATGIITVHNDSGTSQPLVATTRFLSSENVLFRLKNRITVSANSTAEAEVYADEDGAGGNIERDDFTIPGLNENRQKQVYGKSDEAMTGGIRTVGILSQSDVDEAEKKMLEQAKVKGQAILSERQGELGGIYSVVSYRASTDVEVGEEVPGFTVTVRATVLGVFYTMDEVVAMANDLLMKRVVDDTEIIQSAETLPTVTVESYDEGLATLAVFYDGLASLNPESKQLDKKMFFGKSRDEIRRYVLSLDHVQSVDVKFSPAWMQSAPQVNDHVNVVVKNVR